ncbi:hypothetical protein LguiA_004954 [Lonicera macranthoides]
MLTNNKGQNHKKQAEVSDSEEDRLSKLPEVIITQILSFLSTRESVRTSILSTRWKYIWSSVPALDLMYSDFESKAYSRDVNFQKRNVIDNFLNVVDRLLTGHSQHVLDKVQIDGSSSGTHDGARINAWICAAIKRNVHKLHLLGLDSTKPHELHQSLLSSNALVVLKLNVNVILNFPMTSTCFPNLKVLELEDLVIFKDDTSAQNLISSCPVLEDLFISRDGLHNFRTLNLTSWSLKKLVLRHYGTPDDTPDDTVQIIVIDIPALETLDIFDLGAQEYVVKDLSSIINAKLDVSNEYCGDPMSYGTCLFELLIKRIFNVKYLQLSGNTMFSLLCSNSYNVPLFRNLTYLKFFDDSDLPWKLKLVMEFLKNSPVLEVLIFEGFYFLHEEQGTPFKSDVVPTCFASHLKTIKISGGSFEGSWEMVRYFLKNAKVLKELTVKTNYEELKWLKIDCEDIFKHRRGSMTWSDGKLAISFV